MSHLSLLIGAAASHMTRRLSNTADSDGRHVDQPIFAPESVARILEPMVVPRTNEELSWDGVQGMGRKFSKVQLQLIS